MQALRRARVLARLVLAWFALTVSLAIAAPWVQPQGTQWLCTGGVMKLVADPPGDGPSFEPKTLDCPLCSTDVAPLSRTPDAQDWATPGPALRQVVLRVAATAPGMRPPARGPPATS